MIECTGRLHDLITQSHKLDGQVIVTDQTTRHTRPYPPARIRECRKFAVENVELETLPNCPCLAGSFIGRHQRDRPARLARIAPPGNAHPIAVRTHLGAQDAVHISRKLRSNQSVTFGCSRSAVPKAGGPTAHPGGLTRLAQAVNSHAARHQTVRSVAAPRASSHEVFALRFGLKSEHATRSVISPAYGRFHHEAFFDAPSGPNVS
jgi:hypothetical protein